MDEIYDEMRERNHANVRSNGFRHDDVISETDDPRKCLALYSMYGEGYDNSVELAPAFWQLRADLQAAVGSEQVFYMPYDGQRARGDIGGPLWGTLHFTTMQIVGFNDYAGEPLTEEFSNVVRAVMQTRIRPFTIEYTGVIAVPSGLLMIGYPSEDVNAARDRLREALKRRGLPFKEPYYNNIVHSTLLRFSRPITQEETAAVMDVVSRYERVVLARATVREATLSPASWRMQPWELPANACKIPLLGGLPRGAVIAHRGLEPGRPGGFWSESSLQAFESQLRRGFGVEFDPVRTADGVLVVSHDASLERLTGGADKRSIPDLTAADVVSAPLSRPGRLATLDELLALIQEHGGAAFHAMHVKGDRQDDGTIDAVADALSSVPLLLERLIVFDLTPHAAARLRSAVPGVQLAASTGHAADIARYGGAAHGTLLDVGAVVEAGLYQWAWCDEWDLSDGSGGAKQLYTPDVVQRLREAGLKVAIVSPELHGTSPGLLGGESHHDAGCPGALFTRLRQILGIGVDAVCTDYTEEVAALML